MPLCPTFKMDCACCGKSGSTETEETVEISVSQLRDSAFPDAGHNLRQRNGVEHNITQL